MLRSSVKGKNALNTELEELKSELVKLQQAQRDSATALRMVESAASQYESMQQTCDEDAKEFEALIQALLPHAFQASQAISDEVNRVDQQRIQSIAAEAGAEVLSSLSQRLLAEGPVGMDGKVQSWTQEPSETTATGESIKGSSSGAGSKRPAAGSKSMGDDIYSELDSMIEEKLQSIRQSLSNFTLG